MQSSAPVVCPDNPCPSLQRVPVTKESLAQIMGDNAVTNLADLMFESATGIIFSPVTHKAPATKEYLAQVVGGNAGTGHSREDEFGDILYKSVESLIFKFAWRYEVNSRDDINDLVNDCAARIFKNISKFDPDKANFTTWVWSVCTGVLNTHFKRGKRKVECVPEWREGIDADVYVDANPIETNEIERVIMSLFAAHPEHRDILVHVFGDPHQGVDLPLTKICVAKVARELKLDHNVVNEFVRKTIRNHFTSKGMTGK